MQKKNIVNEYTLKRHETIYFSSYITHTRNKARIEAGKIGNTKF